MTFTKSLCISVAASGLDAYGAVISQGSLLGASEIKLTIFAPLRRATFITWTTQR